MTISSTARRAGPFLGNDSATAFAFTFKVFSTADITVTTADSAAVETTLVLDTDYTVTLNANQDTSPGGVVTYPISGSALPTGSRLTIIGSLAYDQPLDLPSGGNFNPTAIENEFDRIVMQVQQLREVADRSITASVTSSVSGELPVPQAGRLLGWDQSNTAIVNYSIEELTGTAAYATWVYDTFTGNGVKKVYALQKSPGNIANCDVSVDGQTLVPITDFTVSGSNLTFITAPRAGAEILVRYGSAAPQGTYAIETERKVATAGQTVVTLTELTYVPGANNISVYVNGARKSAGIDFTETSSTSITFESALSLNDEVVCVVGNEVSQALNAQQVGYLAAGTGAVTRDVRSVLRERVSVKDFGAVGDGITDDRAAIQAAIDAVSAAGGGTVIIPDTAAYYRIRLALQAKNNVTIVVPNNATRIVCTADGTGAKWPIYGLICFGGYTSNNYTRATAYAANAVTRGDESVTLTTAADSTNFAVGDVVAIETTTTFTIGSYTVPTWLQMNVVTASSSGVVSLRRPINQTQSSVKLRQLTTNLTFLNYDGTNSGYPMKAVRDFSLLGGTWENTNPEAPFTGDGGAIDCAIKPFKTVAGFGAVYGNLFAHCQLGEKAAITSRNSVEIAYGSHDNVVEINTISANNDYAIGDPERIVGINEGSHDNVVRIGTVDVATSSPTDIVQLVNAYRNSVEIGTLTGSSAAGAVVQINRIAYTGTTPDTYDNVVQISASNIGSQQRYVQIGTLNSYRNRVIGNFYGTTSADAISVTATDNVIDGYFENGVISETSDSSRNTFKGRIGTGRAGGTDYARLFSNRYDTTTTSYSSLRALGFILDSATYTSTGGLSKTVTFPAGTLIAGDILRFTCRGRCTGATGTKVLQLAFGGTTFLDLSGGSAIPSGTQGVFVDAEIYVSGNTVVTGHVLYTIGATTTQADIGITGLNLSTTSYNFVQTISVASAGDTFTARQSRLFCHRPFADNTPW